MIKFLSLLFSILIFGSTVSYAAFPNQTSDLQVILTSPATVSINTATTYTIEIKNKGSATAQNIGLTVELPLTNTSPSTHILGSVSGLQTGCSVINKTIVCTNLGSLKNGKTRYVTYNYTAPVANKPLTMKASVTSSSTDPVSTNNNSSLTPNLVYPTRLIATPTTITNSHCTGTNLTSYFECLLYPSSISTHNTVFNSDGSITLSEPGYSGSWSQPTSNQLNFVYTYGSTTEITFSGFATNGSNCFEGVSTFPNSTYISPYKVCIQN